jgi:two-component system invasion response regulator UvrY
MRVLIADDHAIVREGLRLILAESDTPFTVGEASNGATLLERVGAEAWDLVILDLSLPDRSGLDLLRDLRTMRPRLPVLILSMHAEEQYAVRALRSGAAGYLTKETASEQLLEAILRITRGGRYVTPAVAEALAAEISGEARSRPHELLSDREFEVLCLSGRGRTPTEIARQLDLSVKTVSTYRSRIVEKLGLRNHVEMILYAKEHELL